MTRDQPPSIVPDDVNIANYIAAVDHAAWRGATTDRTTDNGMTESVDYAAVPTATTSTRTAPPATRRSSRR